MRTLIAMCFMLLQVSFVCAERVGGYYRKNGTYVDSYDRTPKDSNPYNNYSTPGNYNPNSGKVTTGDVDNYVDKYNKRRSKNTYDSDSYGGYGQNKQKSIYDNDND